MSEYCPDNHDWERVDERVGEIVTTGIYHCRNCPSYAGKRVQSG